MIQVMFCRVVGWNYTGAYHTPPYKSDMAAEFGRKVVVFSPVPPIGDDIAFTAHGCANGICDAATVDVGILRPLYTGFVEEQLAR